MKTYLAGEMRGLIMLAVALSLLSGCNQRPSSSPESSRQELNRRGIAFNNEAFIEAAGNGEVKKVLLFLDAGMNPDVTDGKGRTGLMEAAAFDEVATVQLLLARRADVNLKDRNGVTALTHAVITGSADALRVLVDAGADVNIADNRGATALIYAALDGHSECVSILVERGANLEEITTDGDTALLLLVEMTQQSDVRAPSWKDRLLKRGIDPISALRILIDHGANVNATNKKGQTALALAEENDVPEIIDILRKAGAHT